MPQRHTAVKPDFSGSEQLRKESRRGQHRKNSRRDDPKAFLHFKRNRHIYLTTTTVPFGVVSLTFENRHL